MVRFISNNFEVYDGSSWLPLQSSYPQVELDGITQEAIQWTRRRMEEEKRMQALGAQHPAVADALAARQRAEDVVRITVALCDVK
jgi:hypothetical protein